MSIMYSFCFWYSVRLGTIIVAFTCIAQCLAALIACLYGMSNLQRTSSDVEYFLETVHLKLVKDFFQLLRDEPKNCLVAFITVLVVYFCSCISLIYAAFQCNVLFMYPFMVLDFIRLVLLSFTLVVVLMLIKENTLNLGIIIGSSILGGFTMLYLWYQWFCTISLWQVIREIERLDRALIRNRPTPNITRRDLEVRRESDKLNPFYNDSLYLPTVSH